MNIAELALKIVEIVEILIIGIALFFKKDKGDK